MLCLLRCQQVLTDGHCSGRLSCELTQHTDMHSISMCSSPLVSMKSQPNHQHTVYTCCLLLVLSPLCSLVVTPLCAKLSSQDPAAAVAARSEAVAAALAASRSGLARQLHITAQDLVGQMERIHDECGIWDVDPDAVRSQTKHYRGTYVYSSSVIEVCCPTPAM